MIIAVIIVVLVVCYFLYKQGIITFKAYENNEEVAGWVTDTNELIDERFYVFDGKTYFLCPKGDINWGKNSFVNHTIWFTSSNDDLIPTFYPGDKLLYISKKNVPFKGLKWERFADYGYTIGVANLEGDQSGHYHIVSNGDEYKGYVYKLSDANSLNDYSRFENLFLDKVGDVPVRDISVSKGGTVLNLDKDKEYVCEWYTGTYFQDFKMLANVHTFGILESFETFNYEFLHSNIIEIEIPSYLKSGYYYIDEICFFRFVEKKDVSLYNGQAYDPYIKWNDPIIIYDSEGHLLYDPTTGIDNRDDLSDSGLDGYEDME